MRKSNKFNLEDLNIEEVEKIRSLACLDELNIFYDRNKIIVALCNELLKKINIIESLEE